MAATTAGKILSTRSVMLVSPAVGMPVNWYATADCSDPHPGIIADVGHDSLNIVVLSPVSRSVTPQDGVRWRYDNRPLLEDTWDAGFWDYPEWFKTLWEAVEK